MLGRGLIGSVTQPVGCMSIAGLITWHICLALPASCQPVTLGMCSIRPDVCISDSYYLLWCVHCRAADLPKLQAWESACLSHPAVSGSMHPPDSSKPYLDQLLENYQHYITERKAAIAKQ